MRSSLSIMHIFTKVCLLVLILQYSEGALSQRRLPPPPPGLKSQSCRDILARQNNAPSGEYRLLTSTKHLVKVYCEFGIDGGPYTFYHPSAYAYLTQADIRHAQKDTRQVLLRAHYTDGTQPYGVAKQLTQYARYPVKALMNTYVGYNSPQNVRYMGTPYLYVGFIPTTLARSKTTQGLTINGSPITFRNCDANPNSYISFFANYKERKPISYATTWNWGGVCANMISKMVNPPSARHMPVDYFTFTETHWGGCGCYGQTVRTGNTANHKLLAMTVGLR